MGHAVAVRTDYPAGEVRRLAQRAKDAAQARRLLAIAAVLAGASREEAARIGGMDRQTLRDWVIRFNDKDRTLSSIFLLRECRPSSRPCTRPFSPIVEEGPAWRVPAGQPWRG
jgi:Winged helix-turn helix